MKRFRFRLERLERLRDLARREARAAWVTRLALLREREGDRQEAEQALEGSWAAELPAEMADDIEAWRRLYAWRDARGRGLDRAREAERVAFEEAERSADTHRQARQAHRVLEKLRERRRERWQDDAELEERKFLDEVHQLRVVRDRGTTEEA